MTAPSRPTARAVSLRKDSAFWTIKVTIVIMVIAFGAFYVSTQNWVPYIPENTGTIGEVEAYDPATNTWQVMPSLPGAVHGNAMGCIGNKLHSVSGKMRAGGPSDAPDVIVIQGFRSKSTAGPN